MEPREMTEPAAPRHLRRRRFWHSTSSEAFPAEPSATTEFFASPPDSHREANAAAVTGEPGAAPFRPVNRQRLKRAVALATVILTCLVIAALLLALIFWS